MTRTDLYVNKPHCAAAVRPWESEATTSTLPPARVRTCSDSNNSMEKSVSYGDTLPHTVVGVEVVASLSQGRTVAAQCGLFTYKSVPVIFEPPCTWMPRSYVKEEMADGAMESKYRGRKAVRTNSRVCWKEDVVCTSLMHCVKTRRKVNIGLVLGYFYVQNISVGTTYGARNCRFLSETKFSR